MAARDAPSTNTMVSATAIIQDELGHANIAYRLLEDLGVDRHWLLYEREPAHFKHPYGFDQPLMNWAELVSANALYDRAGITLLGDVHRNTSYGPLKRGLVKVSMEENFHLRHGEVWIRRFAEAGARRRKPCSGRSTGCFRWAWSGSGCPTTGSTTTRNSTSASRG